MNLSQGRVTQNGHWISYKCNWGGSCLSLIYSLVEELNQLLDNEKISADRDFSVKYADNSNTRKGCVTIVGWLFSDENLDSIPYEADSVN